jgi:hypothetical protein
MREVKDKWRAFNKSVILDRDIDYLLMEQDPNYVTSDLTEEQRNAQQLLRPFEIGKDKHGNQGLTETATSKFYYNCNTQIIEQRLSNGYYKRPKEFLFDLKTIAKDHKMTGVHDKIIKANDMYGYAMAECEVIEMMNPQLIINSESVYHREQEREKIRQAEAGPVPKKPSNIPPPAPDSTVPSGPIVLGESVGLEIHIPHTPAPHNAVHRLHDSHHTNGETVPSRPSEENTDAMDIDEPSSGSRPQFPGGFTETPSNPTTYQQSQQSGIHKVAPGVNVNDLQNSASTTTSGNKTSDRTSRGSDPRLQLFRQTQSTNGNSTQDSWGGGNFPDFNSIQPPIDGSQLPDTQSTDSKRQTIGTTDSFIGVETQRQMSNGNIDPSQELEGQEFKHPGLPASLQHAQSIAAGTSRAPPDSMIATAGSVAQGDESQQKPSQPRSNGHDSSVHHANIADILNPETPPMPPPPFVLDEALLDELHQWIAKSTENLTVEQLEMIDARCLHTVYQSRSKWDRNPLLEELKQIVEEVLEDVAWQGQLNTAVAATYE